MDRKLIFLLSLSISLFVLSVSSYAPTNLEPLGIFETVAIKTIPKQSIVKINKTEIAEKLYKRYEELMKYSPIELFEKERKEFHAYDLNFSIEMIPDGIVRVKEDILIQNKNVSDFTIINTVTWMFDCFDFISISDDINTTICPMDKANFSELWWYFATEELKQRERNTNITFSLPYLLVDNKTGKLTSYKYNMTPSEDNILKKIEENEKNLLSFFDLNESIVSSLEFDVDFAYKETSHCIKFPIPRFSNITVIITMLSPIVNYSLPLDYITNFSIKNNILVAKVRVYPCCGIENISLQTIKVCS